MTSDRRNEALACLIDIQRATSRLIEIMAEGAADGDPIDAIIGTTHTRGGDLNATPQDARDCDVSNERSEPTRRPRAGRGFVSDEARQRDGGPWVETANGIRRRRGGS